MNYGSRVKKNYKTGDMQIIRREDKNSKLPRFTFSKIVILCLLITCYFSLAASVHSEILERIVAIVNDNVILLSEYEEALQAAKISNDKLTNEMVLNEIIDRMLILEQAKRLRLGVVEDSTGSVDDDRTINEYIDRRIRSFVYIPIEKIESYYIDNKEQFAGKAFYEVKDEIEEHLAQGILEIKLTEHVEELRRKAYIRIQKDPAE